MKHSVVSSISLLLVLFYSSVIGASERPNTCKLHEQLAKDGVVKSQVLAGNCYRTGRLGAAVDLEKAEYWYKKAAETGDASGMLALANLYLFDMKAEEKYSEAANLLKLAANKDVSNASFGLGLLHLNGIAVDKDIDLAKRFFERAASEEHGWSMLAMYTISTTQRDKERWKKRYQEVYSKFYSWETGYENFKNDEHVKEYIIDPLGKNGDRLQLPH